MNAPITPAITTGAGAIADSVCRDGGVDTVFGLPGVHNLALWPACARAGVRIVGSRHEQGCAYAADGYTHATGRTGVAFTTTGPGAANTLGAVGEAWASHSPVVVFASDIATSLRRPGTYRGVLHECTDQAALFAPVTKARLVAGRADDLGTVVAEALALANHAPRGPVYVGVPTDLLSAPIAGVPFTALHHAPTGEPGDESVAPNEREAVLGLLAASERPLIWIGGGTREAGAEVDAFARALGAPVIATFQARGVLPASHPLLVGAPPHEPQVTALVEQSDFVLVVGSDLDHMNTMGWRLPLPASRAAINVEPHDATKNYEMHAVIAADAAVALRTLTAKIDARRPWIDDVSAIARSVRAEFRADPEFAPAIDFLERTRNALPDNAVVFADMCIAGYWLSGQYPVECERGLHYPMGWGTLGFAFPASIGAAVAVGPQRPVVAVMGDGGMLFALGELAAVAQERLALTVVVVDDGGYGMLRFGHETEPDSGCDLSPVDFVAVAEGFGIAAEHVDGLGDDFAQALAKAAASGEPRLIHAHHAAARAAAHDVAPLVTRRERTTELRGRAVGFRVTYATMSADDDALHAEYDRGIETARSWLGESHNSLVNGEHRPGIAGQEYEERSPIDRDLVIGTFAHASAEDVSDAVAAARAAAPGWAATPWKERVSILERAADQISKYRSELAALMAMEVGKNRLEALGDVEESADLIRYYCHQMTEHDGFAMPMGRLVEREVTSDVMRPYGVWAVISPFNFPMALAAGPIGAALVAGNTAVLKPSEQGVFTGLMTVAAMHEAGVPTGVLHAVTGPGETVGAALVADPRVDGLTFTGSYETGMHVFRTFATAFPKPVICEMGGKNPVIISSRADIDAAAEGTMRSAFGLQGQKCSAASRAYVERTIYSEFVTALVEKTRAIDLGNPLDRGVYVGPVIDEAAVGRFEAAVEEARRTGQLFVGGHRVVDGDLARGNYVEPTVIEVPRDSALWETELFVPLITLTPVDSLDEAFDLAHATPLALTAGFFSEDPAEVDRFLERVEAGVVYVNRRAGATTGAWPGVQPFGGWKGSGTNGKAGGGPYYLQQYLREQSRTLVSPINTVSESSTQ